MSTNKYCISVLAPNGRRQNVPVTPNTTLLMVLEEVCKKQGFNPDEYDLKHHNHAIDLTLTIRFSGLPNNAQLEICQAKQKRFETDVNIILQLESGERISGTFPPSENLWNIICKLCPNDANPDSDPVIIYMRQEIQGSENLKSTILRSIGLTGGNALLRYVHRTPEQLQNQASVYKPFEQSKPKQPKLEDTNRKETKTDKLLEETIKEEVQKRKNEFSKTTEDAPQNDYPKKKEKNEEKILNRIKGTSKHCSNSTMSGSNKQNNSSKKSSKSVQHKSKVNEDIREIIYLDERNALIFDQNQINAVPDEELPEDFFELTITDAQIIYRDLQTRRKELEDAPLVFGRGLEDSKRVLQHLHQYNRTIIRIRFPDLKVLQGIFRPSETINEVHTFVKKYINDPEAPFYLYTTPPKVILDPFKTLVELECVPRALLLFGLDAVDQHYTFLKTNLKEKFTTPSTATLAACRSKKDVSSDVTKQIPSTSRGNQGE